MRYNDTLIEQDLNVISRKEKAETDTNAEQKGK